MQRRSGELLDHLCARSELIVQLEDNLTLLHDLYGEYLAGAHVARQYSSRPRLLLETLNVPKARLHAVAAFVPAALVHYVSLDASWNFIEMLLGEAAARQNGDRDVLLAQLGFMALAHNRGGGLPQRRAELLRRGRALYRLLETDVNLATRAQWLGLLAAATMEETNEAGAALARHLDDLLGGGAWVSVPDMRGTPGCGTVVAVARAPVLVGEFAAFESASDNGVAGGGDDGLWDHADVPRLLRDDSTSYAVQSAWASQLPALSAPVTGVSGHEAVAYCRWCTLRAHAAGSLKENEFIRLPTPHEWEVIARRGDAQLLYPWGDAELEAGEAAQANWFGAQTDLDGPSPVGLFKPAARLPGLFDFGSNVQNWAAPEGVPWPPPIDRSPGRWQVLGGSWACDRPNFQIHRRRTTQPASDFRSPLAGFRLVLARQ
jgi:hypothetical protein